MRFRLVLLLAAALLAAVPTTAEAKRRVQACSAASARPSEAGEREIVRATLCLLNEARARRGLAKLRLNPRLSTAAERHSRDMVERGFFAHDSLSGASFVDRIRRTGYLSGVGSWSLGENLAWGSGTRATPQQTLRAWMNSSGHRTNILNPRFREVGIGVVDGSPVRANPAATYTTDFGFRG